MPKYYKLIEGQVVAMELRNNARLITLVKGPLKGKQEEHEQQFGSFAEAQTQLAALCTQASSTGWLKYGQLHPDNTIGEEYYLPKEELNNRIYNQLNPQTDDDKTIRPSE